MNLRFDCFVWSNWSALVNTEFDRCITASIADISVFKRSTSEITSVNTGTGVCEKRRPRSAHECVSANLRGARAAAHYAAVAVLTGVAGWRHERRRDLPSVGWDLRPPKRLHRLRPIESLGSPVLLEVWRQSGGGRMSRLDWPAGFERTPMSERERNRSFEATLGSTTSELVTEMDRMGVDHWRGEIANAHTKSNGLPLHNANPEDPGFVLRWSDDGEQFAVACDASPRLRDNVRYVLKWVNETRMRSQRPVETGDTEFAAARLPPADADAVAGTATSQPAHEVLGVAPDAPENVVESAARARKAETHPDSGGDQEEFQRVVEAEGVMLDE